ncbi:manganese peroxidase 2 [Pyrrhoderma noxium]|uniref:Peroxidase n=1 Tax=Pyrrhoderma noxium TaxID=2282107 RepID=A0A286UFP5_9AGAM|nr:manganese peroxidase 2 [Pyrrhoderma noxium]
MVLKVAASLFALASLANAGAVYRAPCPNSKHTAINPQCCVFYDLADALQSQLFDNQCGEEAHENLRLTFHDAIGFSASGKLKGTGADGSIMIFRDTELLDGANNGIDDSIDNITPFLSSGKFNVTAGDLIQFAGAVGVSNCPGAPRLEFLAGRPNATFPTDVGAVPLPEDPVEKIKARMTDAGLTLQDIVNLLASHSVARSDTLIPAEGEMRLQSDFAISRDPDMACFWQDMINNQKLMMNAFKTSMSKMAILGHNRKNLIDCSEAVPIPVPPVKKPTTFPATKSIKDVEQVCPKKFPTLSTDPGVETQIPKCPDGTDNCES